MSEAADVTATIEIVEGATIRGPMVDIGTRTVTVECAARELRDLALGDRAMLDLRGAAVGGGHRAHGHVAEFRTEGETGRIVIRYALDEDFAVMTSHGIGRLFNRRQAFRMAPTEESPVQVTVSDVARLFEHTGAALDVSATGLGVVIPSDHAELAPRDALMRMAVLLPGHADPIALIGRVCFRAPTRAGAAPAGLKLGIDFDEEATEHFEERVEAIVNYIMRVQREALRLRRLEARAKRV